MANERFIIEVEVDAASAQRTMDNLIGSVGQLATTTGNSGVAKVEKGLNGMATGAQKATRQTQKLNQGLSTTRYALYDVSYTLGLAGAAMLALPAASLAAAISFERDFANVIRTTGVTGDAVDGLEIMHADRDWETS